MRVRISGSEEERRNGAELFAKLELFNVKGDGALSDVGHLLRLQRRHALFTLNAQLLRVRPFLG